jgi:hypothetical protein
LHVFHLSADDRDRCSRVAIACDRSPPPRPRRFPPAQPPPPFGLAASIRWFWPTAS